MSKFQMTMAQESTRAIENLPVLPPNPEASVTGFSSASVEARRIWGIAVAKSAERAYEQRVLSTPGILDALDEAAAEIEAMEDSP
jgi:hypothetical protein